MLKINFFGTWNQQNCKKVGFDQTHFYMSFKRNLSISRINEYFYREKNFNRDIYRKKTWKLNKHFEIIVSFLIVFLWRLNKQCCNEIFIKEKILDLKTAKLFEFYFWFDLKKKSKEEMFLFVYSVTYFWYINNVIYLLVAIISEFFYLDTCSNH